MSNTELLTKMVRIARVWAEHHEPDTIGIGEDRPRISWSFAGDDRNWEQICYEVEAKHDDGRLSSVTIESSQSRLVPWPFRPLSSRERVEVRVRVAGTANSRSDWSSPLVIEAGLLRSDDWSGCQLIEPSQPTETVPGKHRPVIFRRRLVLPEGAAAKRARLYITAHGIYEAHINGFRIGDQLLAPGWTSYQERLAYQTYEIEPQLLAGQENQIDVDVAEGWFCGSLAFLCKHNLYGSRIGLIALILVEMDDGTIVRTGTDAEWEWAHGPMVEAGLLDGVTYDAREGLSASTVWRTVQTGSDGCITRLTAPDGPPIRQTQELPVRAILTSPSGKTILDFGQNFVGWVRLRSVSGPAGTTIRFRHAEVLEDGEIGVRPLRSAKCLDTLIIDGAAPIPWEPKFTFHRFRYVEVDGWPAASPLTVEDVVGVVIHSDMRRTGHFRCSDPLLNRLHENIVWSMRGNFVGIPTDCPQRDERLGWTGDINMFADTVSFLFDVSGMLSSWMKDMMVEQNAANGVVPLVIPYILGDFGPGKSAEAMWGDVAVMLPWALYVVSGDIQLLQRHYQSMKDWLNAIPRSASGLWKQAGHKLADWLDPSAPADGPLQRHDRYVPRMRCLPGTCYDADSSRRGHTERPSGRASILQGTDCRPARRIRPRIYYSFRPPCMRYADGVRTRPPIQPPLDTRAANPRRRASLLTHPSAKSLQDLHRLRGDTIPWPRADQGGQVQRLLPHAAASGMPQLALSSYHGRDDCLGALGQHAARRPHQPRRHDQFQPLCPGRGGQLDASDHRRP